jgi:DNA polymerase I-like protein with 3'-5' exonuclease and polymerase domains
LTIEERDIIENSFKENIIMVIVATSTLSSGVNLPARRVIIRTPLFNGHLLDTMTYRQMIGRAGRKGIDTMGESILMCNNPQEKRLGEDLIKSQLPPIKSCLIPNKSENNILTSSMKRAVLEIIASSIAIESNDLKIYLSCTLLNAECVENDPNYNSMIEQSIVWLVKSDFITKVKQNEREIFKATPLGNAVLASSMSPDEGLIIFKELQKALQCFVLENELQIVYEITPINICDYWLNMSSSASSLSCKLIDWNHYLSIIENFSNDKKRVANLVGVRESFIIRMIRGKSITTENDKVLLKTHLRFYTSLILNDLVNEKPFSKLIDEYKCQKGFLQQLQQSAATYSGMITIFCNRLGWFNLEVLITQFQSRLTFGIQRELCDLIRISLLNSYRARLLYNNGYTNIRLLATAGANEIEKLFRSTIVLDNVEAKKMFERKTVWNDGMFYTNWEAAVAIINEAKAMIFKEVEFLGLKITDLNKTEKDDVDLTSEKVLDGVLESSSQLDLEEESLIKNYVKNTTISAEKIIQNLSTSIYNLSINDSSDLDAAAIALAHQVTSNKIDVTPNKIEKSPILTQNGYTLSYFDNQNMILMANEYDVVKKVAVEKVKEKAKIINTTIISDEILEMCQMYENDRRNSIFKTPLTPKLSQSPRMQMIDKALETPKHVKNESLLMNNTVNQQQEDVKNLMNLLPKNLHSTICINKVSKECDFENLNKLLKNLKTFLSISITFETEIKNKNTILGSRLLKEKANFGFCVIDQEKNECIKLQSIFLSFYNAQMTKVFIIELDGFKNETEKEKRWLMIKNLFENILPTVQKVCIQAKEKLKLLVKALKVELRSNLYDPLVAHWLLENEMANLNDLKQKYCSNNFLFSTDYNYRKKKPTLVYALDSEIRSQEAFLESLVCLNCIDKLKLKLQLDNLWSYFCKIESEVMIIAAYSELNGIGFDSNECLKQMNIVKFKQNELEKKIYVHVAPVKLKNGFSLNSPQDIANLLYVDLKLTPPIIDNKQQKSKRMTTARVKHHSTAKAVLEKLSEQHELPRLILEWRQIQNSLAKTMYPVEKAKFFNTYLNMYRIHSSHDMCTLTGRLILNEPCLQIIPKDFDIFLSDSEAPGDDDENDDDDGLEFFKNKFSNDDDYLDEELDSEESTVKFSVSLRNAFIPFKNGILLSADYCQLELRIIAHLCKDKLLQAIVNNDENDVFLLLASEWMGLSIESVSDIQRQQTKQVSFF